MPAMYPELAAVIDALCALVLSLPDGDPEARQHLEVARADFRRATGGL